MSLPSSKSHSASQYATTAAAAQHAARGDGNIAQHASGMQCRPAGQVERFCQESFDIQHERYNTSSSGEALIKGGDLLRQIFIMYRLPRLQAVAAGAQGPAGWTKLAPNNIADLYAAGHINKEQVEAVDDSGILGGYSQTAEFALLKSARLNVGSHIVSETSGLLELIRAKMLGRREEGLMDFHRFADRRHSASADHERILPLDFFGSESHGTAVVLAASQFTQFRVQATFHDLSAAVWVKSSDYDVYASSAAPEIHLGTVQSYLPPAFSEKLRAESFHELITQQTAFQESITLPANGATAQVRFDQLPLNLTFAMGLAVIPQPTAFEGLTTLPNGNSPIAKVVVKVNALEHANTSTIAQQFLAKAAGYDVGESGIVVVPFSTYKAGAAAGGLPASAVDRVVADVTVLGEGTATPATAIMVYHSANTLFYGNSVANLGYAS